MISLPEISPEHTTTTPLGTNDPVLQRGWFYRAIAPDPDVPVFAVGAPFARRWFSNVTEGTLAGVTAICPATSFGLVIVHATLGGCPSLVDAFRAAFGALTSSGVVAFSGDNRLRSGNLVGNVAGRPSATPWGYRQAAQTAGFDEVELFVARPSLVELTSAFSTRLPSSRAFYRFELASRQASGIVRWPRTRALLADVGLLSWFESTFILVATKC